MLLNGRSRRSLLSDRSGGRLRSAPSAITDFRAIRRMHPPPPPVRRRTSEKEGGDVSATLASCLVSGLDLREGAEVIRAIDLDGISEP